MSSKISALPAGTPALTTDMLPINRSGTNYSLTVSDINALNIAGPYTPGGRLTLTTGVPVTTSDVTAAGTLYYTPYIHDYIMLYSGSVWQAVQFTERSISLTGLTTTQPYDVFCYNNSGTATLELLAWTNNTTRATALVYQNGRRVKSGAATRLYLGTVLMSATSQMDDSAAHRYLSNAYNVIPTTALLNETSDISTTSDTYTDATATLSVVVPNGESLTVHGVLSKGSNATQDHFTRVDMDGSVDTGAAPTTASTTSGYPAFAIHSGVLTPGVHAFKIQWRRTTTSGTATCRPTTEPEVNYRRLFVIGLLR